MFAICWRVLSTMVLLCGASQPQRIAQDTLAIEMGRYDPMLSEFADVSPPLLLPEGPEVLAARRRLNASVNAQ